MNSIFFDTEGNGNNPDQMCQMSYLMVDGNVVESKNFYFSVSTMNEYALKVHGLSKAKLYELSHGRTFSDAYSEIYGDFSASDIVVGHNVRSDLDRLSGELRAFNLTVPVKHKLCTMLYFNNALKLIGKTGNPKYPRLSELCDYYDLDDRYISSLCDKVFHAKGISFHDARYDATATYACVRKATERGDIRGVF